MMNLFNEVLRYFLFPLFFIVLFFFFIVNPDSECILGFTLLYTTILMIYLFIKTINKKVINLFILFSFSYIIPIYYYLFGNKVITTYGHSNELKFLIKYLIIYALFFVVINFFIQKSLRRNNLKVLRNNNSVIFYINILICLIIAFFSKSGETILNSGGYGQSEIINLGGFAIGEYFLIFFFVAYKFSGQHKFKGYVLIFVAVIYMFESLAFGLRNELIQLSILLFILYFKESKKNLSYFMILIVGFYLSSLFASFRSNPIVFLESTLIEKISVFNLIENDNENYISHQGDVIHSSSRLINFRDNRITNDFVIYSSALYFLSSALVPQKFLPAQANMAAYKKDDYPAGGGGNIFAYFYYWYGYFGVIAIGLFIGFLIKNYSSYLNSTFGAYFILVFSTFPRWFSYSPINLFKMCLYGLVIHVCFLVVNKISKKYIL